MNINNYSYNVVTIVNIIYYKATVYFS